MLDWFLDAVDLRVVNLVSSTLFAVASLVVCAAALRFAHLKNYGWPPIVLETKQGSQIDEQSGLLTLDIEFALWNRRTYPILVRHSEVKFQGMRLEPKRHSSGWSSNERGSFMSFTDPRQTVPNSQYVLAADAKFRVRNPKKFQVRYRIAVHYFDPIYNQVKMVSFHGKHARK